MAKTPEEVRAQVAEGQRKNLRNFKFAADPWWLDDIALTGRLLAAARLGFPVAEYAPLKIKSSVVGYGLAKKEQVQFMVARLLNLAEVPQPADAADALAIAICHIHTAQTLAVQGASR